MRCYWRFIAQWCCGRGKFLHNPLNDHSAEHGINLKSYAKINSRLEIPHTNYVVQCNTVPNNNGTIPNTYMYIRLWSLLKLKITRNSSCARQPLSLFKKKNNNNTHNSNNNTLCPNFPCCRKNTSSLNLGGDAALSPCHTHTSSTKFTNAPLLGDKWYNQATKTNVWPPKISTLRLRKYLAYAPLTQGASYGRNIHLYFSQIGS